MWAVNGSGNPDAPQQQQLGAPSCSWEDPLRYSLWGYGHSSRSIRSKPASCADGNGGVFGSDAAFYSPCNDASSYAGGAASCNPRLVEVWDDVTLPDSDHVNYVDTKFYGGPPTLLWNTNWDLRGDVPTDDMPACAPSASMSSRRMARPAWPRQ